MDRMTQDQLRNRTISAPLRRDEIESLDDYVKKHRSNRAKVIRRALREFLEARGFAFGD